MSLRVVKGGKQKSTAKWSKVKDALVEFNRYELINLVADLYRFSNDNRNFLHTRFSLEEDTLAPYKKKIKDSLYPDVMRDKPLRIADAKRAISQYVKAIGDPKGVLELMVFFVERGNQFTVDFGDIDEPFYLAMLRMYDKALAQLVQLDDNTIREYQPRFKQIMVSSSGIGWGYHDALSDMYYEYLSDYDDDIELDAGDD